MWLITPSNFLAITQKHSIMQTSNLIIVWVLLNLLQHMLSFNLPIVNQPFSHDFLKLGLLPPKSQIISFVPNGPHSDSSK